MTEKKIKKAVVLIPKNLEEAADFIGRIGKSQREIDKIQMELNGRVEKLKAIAVAEAKQCGENISNLAEGVYIFAESQRDALTDGGKRKAVEMLTGSFSWRTTPPAVSIRNIKAVLAKIKGLGLKQFIRIKEELDKEAMLKDPKLASSVKGVRIEQREEFIIKPAELSLEIVGKSKKLED